jgi:hypothetical protein
LGDIGKEDGRNVLHSERFWEFAASGASVGASAVFASVSGATRAAAAVATFGLSPARTIATNEVPATPIASATSNA